MIKMKNVVLITGLILVVAIVVSNYMFAKAAVRTVDKFLNAVESNNPDEVYKLFCRDAVLMGTVSQVERKGEDILHYFEYFANLPNIRVLAKKYSVTAIEPDVQVNNAFVTWTWDGLEKPVVARMTFVVKNKCIFELHSSELPKENEKLYKVSHKF